VINGDGTKKVSTIHHSPQVAPYVLKQRTEAVDAAGKTVKYESLAEVIAIDMPHQVLSEVKSSSHVRTVNKQADGATAITVEVHCTDVPGGVVAHSSKEIAPTGRLIRRSTLELIEYQASTPVTVKRTKLFGKRRLFPRRRIRKAN
jgi:hypothetical protein